MKPFKTFGLIVCYLLLNSCRIGYSFDGISIPEQAKTVSVTYFSNFASLAPPTYSQTFTEALRDKFASQTNLSLTDEDGDLQFEGSIRSYTTAPVAVQTNDQASLNRLTVSVSVNFTNTMDESKNFESSFSRFADFESSQNLADIETKLIEEVNDQLIQDIFNKAFNNW